MSFQVSEARLHNHGRKDSVDAVRGRVCPAANSGTCKSSRTGENENQGRSTGSGDGGRALVKEPASFLFAETVVEKRRERVDENNEKVSSVSSLGHQKRRHDHRNGVPRT